MANPSGSGWEKAGIFLLRWSLPVCFLALILLNLAWKWVLVNSYAPDLGGFERNVIWGIRQCMEGNPLYADPWSGNFALIQYQPLYYSLVAGIGSLLGQDTPDGHGLYQLARGINGILNLATWALWFSILHQCFRLSRNRALFFSGLAFLLMESFSISGRPDALKAFCFAALVRVLLAFPDMRKRYVLGLALLFSTMAFFTKQDGLVYAAICPLWLLWQRQTKEAIGLAVLQAVFLVVPVWLLHQSSHGAYLANVFGGLKNGLSLSWFVSAFGPFFMARLWVFAPALALAIDFLWERHPRLQALAIAFLVAFGSALLFSFKFGSGPNYFAESIWAGCALLGLVVQRFEVKALFFRPWARLTLPTMVLAFAFGISALQWATGVFLHQEKRLKSLYGQQREVQAYLAQRFAHQPNYKVLVLHSRQWEDHLTVLLGSHAFVPTRDVLEQVWKAGSPPQIQAVQAAVAEGKGLQALVVPAGAAPDFLGMDFSRWKPRHEVGGFVVWER
jgi:hypothetical protein